MRRPEVDILNMRVPVSAVCGGRAAAAATAAAAARKEYANLYFEGPIIRIKMFIRIKIMQYFVLILALTGW